MSAEMVALCRSKMEELGHRAARAMEQLEEEDLNWRPNEESNSIANLVVHLEGNLHQFVESGIGGATNRRNRDLEFNTRERFGQAELIARLTGAIERACGVLERLDPIRLDETIPWNNRQMPIRELLLILTTHLGEHVGQILYIAKWRKGEAYQVLSNRHKKA